MAGEDGQRGGQQKYMEQEGEEKAHCNERGRWSESSNKREKVGEKWIGRRGEAAKRDVCRV